MNKRLPGSDLPFSQPSDTLKVVKDVSLAAGTGFLGYLSNFLVNAVNPHFFDSNLGTLLLALTIPLVMVLLYQQQHATPWSGLLIGFVVGIFQSFHFNWFQDHTNENMFKIALILLALMLLLVPQIIRLINQRNVFGGGLLRSLVAALIGWAFWTGGFALFYKVIHANFLGNSLYWGYSLTVSSPFATWLLDLLVKAVFVLIPIITGSLIVYCSGFSSENEDVEKNGWTCLVALFSCWFGLCWSFWKLDWFHLHFTTTFIVGIPLDAFKLVFAIGGLILILTGLACAWYEFGPIAWIHTLWEGCIGFLHEMFGTG